jgi:hypothetical protein
MKTRTPGALSSHSIKELDAAPGFQSPDYAPVPGLFPAHLCFDRQGREAIDEPIIERMGRDLKKSLEEKIMNRHAGSL